MWTVPVLGGIGNDSRLRATAAQDNRTGHAPYGVLPPLTATQPLRRRSTPHHSVIVNGAAVTDVLSPGGRQELLVYGVWLVEL